MLGLSDHELHLIRDWRVARLATADAQGTPHVIPVCFAFDGKHLYSVLDKKPKSTPATNLKRVRNIVANPNVSLVLDQYDEVWETLWYILILGTAELVEAGPEQQDVVKLLRKKYQQYREMDIGGSPVIKITPQRVTSWGRLPELVD